jgi:hypothetical protein
MLTIYIEGRLLQWNVQRHSLIFSKHNPPPHHKKANNPFFLIAKRDIALFLLL